MSHITAVTKKNRAEKNKLCSPGVDVKGKLITVDAIAKVTNRNLTEKKPLHSSMEQLEVNSKTTFSRRAAGSNWNTALGSLKPTISEDKTKCTSTVNNGDKSESNAENSAPGIVQSKASRVKQRRKAAQQNKFVALDCEMVGVGSEGNDDMLARVSIVNKRGEVLLDKFVKPRETVTNYRTSISGIRPLDIENGEEFSSVQDEVVQLLQGKILVGHAIRNDLAVLHIKHPYLNIRDTSRYKPLSRLVANGRTPSLKRVCQAILGLEIQTGEHNSVEDARAAMNIYNHLSSEWEKYIHKHQRN